LFPVPGKNNTANPAAANKAISNTNASTDNSADRAELAKFARQAPGTGGGQGTAQFAATDPRRLDRGDGGKAAVLGAQQNAIKVPTLGITSQGFVPGGQSYLPGQLGSGTYAILPAPVAGVPTTAGGITLAVSGRALTGPSRLPTAGTDPAQVAAQAASASQQDKTNPSTVSPVSSNSSTNQLLARVT
jgi:hypothetical protein